MSNAILQVHGKKYVSEKSIGLYPTTGSADDWFYSDSANELNGKYRSAAYTIELRDTGSYGFLLPPYEVRLHASLLYCGCFICISLNRLFQLAKRFLKP